MASKTTAEKAEKPKSAPRKRPTSTKSDTILSGGNGNSVKQNNIVTATFEVPAEAFTVEAYDDPGPKRARHTFAKITSALAIPDLIELQKASFKWFINDGLKEAFESISPIKDFTGNLVLEFGEHSLGEPKY
jgi:DNA-directed RNA polymerase beta subunit